MADEYASVADDTVHFHLEEAWRGLRKARQASQESDHPYVKKYYAEKIRHIMHQIDGLTDDLFALEDTVDEQPET